MERERKKVEEAISVCAVRKLDIHRCQRVKAIGEMSFKKLETIK